MQLSVQWSLTVPLQSPPMKAYPGGLQLLPKPLAIRVLPQRIRPQRGLLGFEEVHVSELHGHGAQVAHQVVLRVHDLQPRGLGGLRRRQRAHVEAPSHAEVHVDH
eukprot:scaffold7789_cov200-Pinguiococcus_pyrenoidosus.AAC.3